MKKNFLSLSDKKITHLKFDSDSRIGFLEKLTSFIILPIFLITMVLPMDVLAQSVPQLTKLKPFRGEDLQPYVEAANNAQTESEWWNIVRSGSDAVEANWEAEVEAEINTILSSENRSDAVNDVETYRQAIRADLELQKQGAKSEWAAELSLFIQSELSHFLGTKSTEKNTDIITEKDSLLNGVDPTVEELSVNQEFDPTQAAKQYYDGKALWDSKWLDLLTKRDNWINNSSTTIETGINEWNQAIDRLVQEKQNYLSSLDQKEALWLQNKGLVEESELKTRDLIQSMVTSIQGEFQGTLTGNPELSSNFGDLSALLIQIQEKLDTGAPLEQIASTMSLFFSQQQEYAAEQAEWWNDNKTHTGTERIDGAHWEPPGWIGSVTVTCTAGVCPPITSFGTLWAPFTAVPQLATNEVFSLSKKSIMTSGYGFGPTPLQWWDETRANVSLDKVQGYTMGFVEIGALVIFQSVNSTPYENHTENYSFAGGNFEYVLNTMLAGTLITYPYLPAFSMRIENTYSASDQYQIAMNQKIKKALTGNADLNVPGAVISQSAKVLYIDPADGIEKEGTAYFSTGSDGTQQIMAINGAAGESLTNFSLQTEYTYIDTNAQKNEDDWSLLAGKYNSLAETFASMVDPLKYWREKSIQYNEDYQERLDELNALRPVVTPIYDEQINSLVQQRDAWIKNTYGYTVGGNASYNNENSEFRNGMKDWDEKIGLFLNVETNWFLASRDRLKDAVENPDTGELKFVNDTSQTVNSLKTDVVNSEQNTSQLYQSADSLTNNFQYSQAAELYDQAISNRGNESYLNSQVSVLSEQIQNSLIRSETYKLAELDASARLNQLAPELYGQGAYFFTNEELASIQSNADVLHIASSDWADQITEANNKQIAADSDRLNATGIVEDLRIAAGFKKGITDEESKALAFADTLFKKANDYIQLSENFKDEGKFDEAEYYLQLAGKKKTEATEYLNKEYASYAETAQGQLDLDQLSFSKSSYIKYKESLLQTNLTNTEQLNAALKKQNNDLLGISELGEQYQKIQSMLEEARLLSLRGEESKSKVDQLLTRSEELARANVTGDLLDGLQEMISFLSEGTPEALNKNAIDKAIAQSESDLADTKDELNDLIQNMDRVLTNADDIKLLNDLLKETNNSFNLAANSALFKYMQGAAERIMAENQKASEELESNLWEELNSGSKYKYLRDAGYTFRKGSNGLIIAQVRIYDGEARLEGDARRYSSYIATKKDYLSFSVQTKFDPPSLKVFQVDPEKVQFSTELVNAFLNASEETEEAYADARTKFGDKTEEIQANYNNQEETWDYYYGIFLQQRNYLADDGGAALKELAAKQIARQTNSTLAEVLASQAMAPQILPGTGGTIAQQNTDVADNSGNELNKIEESLVASYYNMVSNAKKGYETSEAKFQFVDKGDGYYRARKTIERTALAPTPVGPIPVQVAVGEIKVDIKKDFAFSELGFSFNQSRSGWNNIYSILNEIYDKYNEVTKDAIKYDQPEISPWVDVALGMIGGTGSMSQRFTASSQSYFRGQVNQILANDPNVKALAQQTGVPVGILTQLGNQRIDKATESYAQSLFAEGIEKATGIKGAAAALNKWQGDKDANDAMKKSGSYNIGMALGGIVSLTPLGMLYKQDEIARETYRNRDTVDAIVAAGAVIAAPFTAGASLVAYAGYKAVEGAFDGGVVGALTGLANVGNAFLYATTWGAVSYDVSYSYADGFEGSVGVGYKIAPGIGIGGTVSYSQSEGFGGSIGLQTGNANLSANLAISYTQAGGTSFSAGLGIGTGGSQGKPNGSLNIGGSYSAQNGWGASIGYSANNNVVLPGAGLELNRSEYGGWGASLTTDDYMSEGRDPATGSMVGRFQGVSGALNWNQHTGFSVSMNADGTNLLNYDLTTGILSANSNYIADHSMNVGLREGVEETPEQRADREAENRRAQSQAHQGADVIAGAGYGIGREGDGEERIKIKTKPEGRNVDKKQTQDVENEIKKQVSQTDSESEKRAGLIYGIGTSITESLDYYIDLGNHYNSYSGNEAEHLSTYAEKYSEERRSQSSNPNSFAEGYEAGKKVGFWGGLALSLGKSLVTKTTSVITNMASKGDDIAKDVVKQGSPLQEWQKYKTKEINRKLANGEIDKKAADNLQKEVNREFHERTTAQGGNYSDKVFEYKIRQKNLGK